MKMRSKKFKPPAEREMVLDRPTVLTVRAEGMMVVIRTFTHTKDFEPQHEVRVWSDYDEAQKWFACPPTSENDLLSEVLVVKERAGSAFRVRRITPSVVAALTCRE